MISSGMLGMPQTPRKKGTRQQQTKKKTWKQETAKQATWKSQEHKMRNKAKGNEIIRYYKDFLVKKNICFNLIVYSLEGTSDRLFNESLKSRTFFSY